MDKTAFKNNLGLTELPVELDRLIDFQENHGGYAEGFWLQIDKKYGLSTWSEDKNFLDRLFPIAESNGSGSSYVLWKHDATKPVGEWPVLVFGDEGGVHIVAENMLQLLHLISCDVEILVDHDSAYFYKDENNHEPSEHHDDYVLWLKENFNLDTISDTETLIKNAQEKYQALFNHWMKQYYDL